MSRLPAAPMVVSAAAWWTLGHLGLQVAPLQAGGLGALALWLALQGLIAAAWRRWPLPMRVRARVPPGPAWAVAGLCSGVTTAWALQARGALPLAAAVLAWAVWTVLAARAAAPGLAAPPGRLGADVHRSAGRCTGGLWAAGWSMWPMMASLAPMLQWCGNAGWTPAASALLHGVAMALPLLWLRGVGRAERRAALPTAVDVLGADAPPARRRAPAATMLMLASAGLLVWQPGLRGLMLATLCQAVAWGLATARRAEAEGAGCSLVPATAGAALALSAAVALLGASLAEWGPTALRWVHGGLAGIALAGLAWPGGPLRRSGVDHVQQRAVAVFHRRQQAARRRRRGRGCGR